MESRYITAIDLIDYQYQNGAISNNNNAIFKARVSVQTNSRLLIRGEVYLPPLKYYPSQILSGYVTVEATYKRELVKIQKLLDISLNEFVKKYPYRKVRNYSERTPLVAFKNEVQKPKGASYFTKELVNSSVKLTSKPEVSVIEVTPQIITNLCITEEYSITHCDMKLYSVEKITIPIGDSYYYNKMEVPSSIYVEGNGQPDRVSGATLMSKEETSIKFKRAFLLNNIIIINKCSLIECNKNLLRGFKEISIYETTSREGFKRKGLVSKPFCIALRCKIIISDTKRGLLFKRNRRIRKYSSLLPRKRLNFKNFRRKRKEIYITTSKEYGKP